MAKKRRTKAQRNRPLPRGEWGLARRIIRPPHKALALILEMAEDASSFDKYGEGDGRLVDKYEHLRAAVETARIFFRKLRRKA